MESFRLTYIIPIVLSMLVDEDSLTIQARHYKTLQEMYKKPKPNQAAISQILDLEIQARILHRQ